MDGLKSIEFESVLKKYENIVYYLIHKLGIHDPEKEFYQEGVIALWQATEDFDANRGKFSSYAYFRIEKALIDVIRKNTRQNEKETQYKRMLNKDFCVIQASLESSIDLFMLKEMQKSLTANQMKWFVLFVVEDLSIKQIAALENVTVDAVKNWARLAKPKIRKILDS